MTPPIHTLRPDLIASLKASDVPDEIIVDYSSASEVVQRRIETVVRLAKDLDFKSRDKPLDDLSLHAEVVGGRL